MKNKEISQFVYYVSKMRAAHIRYELHSTDANYVDYLAYEGIVDYLLMKIEVLSSVKNKEKYLVICEN